MTEETTRTTMPHTIAEMQAITHIPTTEATASFGRFMNKYLAQADNFEPVTPEQAWTVIACHRVWQQSEERKQEIADLKASKAKELEVKRAELAEKKEAREAERERKKAEAERKKAEKAEKEAAEADEVGEITENEEGELVGAGAIGGASKRRRRAPKTGESADGF